VAYLLENISEFSAFLKTAQPSVTSNKLISSESKASSMHSDSLDHLSNDEGAILEKVPSEADAINALDESTLPAGEIPNGGFVAWLHVAGAFCIFLNTWCVNPVLIVLSN
jgi:hypothetical protein